ncbi:MAG: AAA domain-containing protein [bacterium]|nr:AAA domain-containing protein [bacterium]
MPIPKFNDYIDEMLLAVRANIEYLKKNGSSQMKIKNGMLISVSGEVYIYQFELDILQEIDPGMDVEVRIHGQSIGGKVTVVTDNTIDLQIESNLGEKITEAILLISNYFLLEKLVDRLEKVKDGSVAHSDAADMLLGILPRSVSLDNAYTLPLREQSLNSSQETALRTCLGSDVSFIWGPPGTGKSETIGNIVEAFLSKGFSVLLISHTNKATDGAMKKVVKLLENTKDYKEGKFIREGQLRSIDPWLHDKNVIPDRVFETRSAPIHAEINAIQSRLNELNSGIVKHEDYLQKVREVEKSEKEAVRLNQVFDSKKREKKLLESQKQARQHDLDEFQQKILQFQEKGFIGKFFSGTNLATLTEKKIEAVRSIDECGQGIEQINKDIWSVESHLTSASAKLESSKVALSSCGVIDMDPSLLKATKKDIKNLKEQLKVLNEQLLSLSDDLIKDAKVVATTLTRSYMSKSILDREYDCVILDEASMAPLPAVICAVGLAQKKAVLVGDFFQLPPIAKHNVDPSDKAPEEVEKEKNLVKKWLKRDIFEFVGITDDIKNGIAPDWLVQLKEQFRMHPDISALVNELVYQHFNDQFKLENGEGTAKYGEELLSSEPLKDAHLGIYDTSQLGPIISKTDSHSIYNVTHALLAVVLAKQALASGYQRIGIISAYRAQVNLINKMLKDEIPESLKYIVADTVHRFQGDEREIIIFDVTTPKPKTMYDDGEGGGDDMKLLNVAFSRAEQKCIIVADVVGINKSHSPSSLVRRAIDHCAAHGRPIINCKQLLEEYSADDRTEEWLSKINKVEDVVGDIENGGLFNETDFYPNFIKDLFRAKQEVIINSPFITSYRSDNLKPIFSHLLKKGIRIFVITRPPEEHKDAMREQSLKELREFEKMGIVVIPFMGNIHQKFSIIDREILWDGSLNILSQRDSTEIMRRYDGNAAVEQLMAFLRLDKNIGEMGKNNLKRCETCKQPGAWYWKKKLRFGNLWTFCLVGIHGVGKKPKTKAEVEKKKGKRKEVRSVIILDDNENPLCPEHKILTVQKDGYWGPYWSCPKVKECDYRVSDTKVKKARQKN